MRCINICVVLLVLGVSLDEAIGSLEMITNFTKPLSSLGYTTQSMLDPVDVITIAKEVSGLNSSELDRRLNSAGLRASLRMNLGTVSIARLRSRFYPLQIVLNPRGNMKTIFEYLRHYDSEFYCKHQVFAKLANHLEVSNDAIEAQFNSSVFGKNGLGCLTNVIPNIKNLTSARLMKLYGDNLENFFGADENVMKITGITKTEFINMNISMMDYRIRCFEAKAANITATLNAGLDKLFRTLDGYIGRSLKTLESNCSVRNVMEKTFEDVVKNCTGLPIAYYLFRTSYSDSERFYKMVTLEQYRVLFGYNVTAFQDLTLKRIEQWAQARIQAGDSIAERSVSIIAFDSGIKHKDIPDQNILDFFTKTLKLTPALIKVNFHLFDNNIAYMNASKMKDIPMLVNRNSTMAEINKIRTMKGMNVMEVISGTSNKEYIKFVEQGMEFIGTRINFMKVLQIHDLTLEEGLSNTIPAFAFNHAGVTAVELAVAFRITIQQESALNLITVRDAGALNTIPVSVIQARTLKDMGLASIRAVIVQPELFRTVQQLLSVAKLRFCDSALSLLLDKTYFTIAQKQRWMMAREQLRLLGPKWEEITMKRFPEFVMKWQMTRQAVEEMKFLDFLKRISSSLHINPPAFNKTLQSLGYTNDMQLNDRTIQYIAMNATGLSMNSLYSMGIMTLVSNPLRTMMMQRNISYFKKMFSPFNFLFVKETTMEKIVLDLITADTITFTILNAEPRLMSTLRMDRMAVRSKLIAPDKILTADNLRFLTAVNPKLPNFLDNTVRNLTAKDVTMYFGSESMLMDVSNVTEMQLFTVTKEMLLYGIRVSPKFLTAFTRFQSIYKKLLDKLTASFRIQFLKLLKPCGINAMYLLSSTIDSFSRKCFKLPMAYYIRTHSSQMLTPIYTKYKQMQFQMMMGNSSAAFLDFTTESLDRAIIRRVNRTLRMAKTPTSILGFDNMLSVSRIPDMKMGDILTKTLKMDLSLISLIFRLSETNTTYLNQTQFKMLPDFVKRYNITSNLNKFLTMSVETWINLVAGRNTAGFIKAVENGMAFIGTNITFGKVLDIYCIPFSLALRNTIPWFAHVYAGVNDAELAVAFNINITLEHAMRNIMTGQVQYIQFLPDMAIHGMTLKQIGQLSIVSFLTYRLSFTSIGNAIMRINATYDNITLNTLIRTFYKGNEFTLIPLMAVLNLAGPVWDDLADKNMTFYERRLGISMANITNMQIVDFLHRLSTNFSRGSMDLKDIPNFDKPLYLFGYNQTGLDAETLFRLAAKVSNLNDTALNQSLERTGFSIALRRAMTIYTGGFIRQQLAFFSLTLTPVRSLEGLFRPVMYFSGPQYTRDVVFGTIRLGPVHTQQFRLDLITPENQFTNENLQFLPIILPKLSGALNVPLTSFVTSTVVGFFGSEANLKSISNVTLAQLTDLYHNSIVYRVRGFARQTIEASNKIMAVLKNLQNTLENFMKRKFALHLSECMLTETKLRDMSIKDLLKQCKQLPINYYYVIARIGSLQGLYEGFKVDDYCKFFRSFTCMELSARDLESMTKMVIQNATEKAKLPLSVAAFDVGIMLNTVHDSRVAAVISLALKVPPPLLQILFHLSPQQMVEITLNTFNNMTQAAANLNFTNDRNNFYTMKISSVMEFVARRLTIPAFVKAVEDGMAFIGTQITFSKVLSVYSLTFKQSLLLTIPSFAHNFSGVNDQQLQVAFNITLQQERALAASRIINTKIINTIPDQILQRFTLKDIGLQTIFTVFTQPLLFRNLSSILTMTNAMENSTSITATLKLAFGGNETRRVQVYRYLKLLNTPRWHAVALQRVSFLPILLGKSAMQVMGHKMIDILYEIHKKFMADPIDAQLLKTYWQLRLWRLKDIQMMKFSDIIQSRTNMTVNDFYGFLKRNGASSYIIDLLNNNTIAGLIERFPKISQYNKPSNMLFQGVASIIVVHSPGYFSEFLVPPIVQETGSNTAALLTQVNLSPSQYRATMSIPSLLPKIKSAITELRKAKTQMFINTWNLTNFQELTGVTVDQYNMMRSDHFYYNLIGNTTATTTKWREVQVIQNKLVQGLRTFSNTPLSRVMQNCSVTRAGLLAHTIESLSLRCQNQSMGLLLSSNNVSGNHVSLITKVLLLDDLRILLMSSEADFMKMTLTTIITKSGSTFSRVNALLDIPVQLPISSASVPDILQRDGSVPDVLTRAFRISPRTLFALLGVPPSRVPWFLRTTFSNITSQVKFPTHMKNYRIMTARAITKIIVGSVSPTEFNSYLVGGFRQILRGLSLSEVINTFKLNMRETLAKDVLAVSRDIGELSGEIVGTASGLGKGYAALMGVSIHRAAQINQLSDKNVLSTTLQQTGAGVLEINQKYMRLFLSIAALPRLLNVNMQYIQSETLAKIVERASSVINAADLFKRLRISGDAVAVLRAKSILQVMALNNMASNELLSTSLMTVLERFARFRHDVAINKCLPAGRYCSMNALCHCPTVSCMCPTGTHGDGVTCYENVPDMLMAKLKAVAAGRRITISDRNSIIKIMENTTSVSNMRLRNILKGQMVDKELFNYLEMNSASYIRSIYGGLRNELSNFDISSIDLIKRIKQLNTKQATNEKLMMLSKRLNVKVDDIITIMGRKKSDILEGPFLSRINCEIEESIFRITQKSTDNLLKNMGISNEQLMMLAKTTAKRYNAYRAEAALANIREDSTREMMFSNKVKSVDQATAMYIMNRLSMSVPALEASCKQVDDVTGGDLDDVIPKCFKFTLRSVVLSLKFGDGMTAEALGDLSLNDVSMTINITNKSESVVTILRRASEKINHVLMVARTPVSLQSYRNGISFATLPPHTIIALALKNTRLSRELFVKAFDVRSYIFPLLNTTYAVLPLVVRNRLNVSYTSNHFLTLTLNGSVNSLQAKERATTFLTEFEKAGRILATMVSLRELQMMYGISNATLMDLTIPRLAETYAGFTPREVQTVLNLKKEQDAFLQKVTIGDARKIMNIGDGILNMTVERIGHNIVNIRDGLIKQFFVTPKEILESNGATVNDLNKVTFYSLTILYGEMNQSAYNMLLLRLGYTQSMSKLILEHAIFFFGIPLQVNSLDSLGSQTVFSLLRKIQLFLASSGNKCKNVICPPKSDCKNIADGIQCNCTTGYKFASAQCFRAAPNSFMMSIQQLATMRNINISDQNTLLMLISSVTNVSISDVKEHFMSYGVLSPLTTYLERTSIEDSINQYHGLRYIYRNFTATSTMIAQNLSSLDTPLVTIDKLRQITRHLKTTEMEVASSLGMSVKGVRRLRFLSEFNKLLSSKIQSVTMKSTRQILMERGVSEGKLAALTNMNFTMYNILRGKILLASISRNSMQEATLMRQEQAFLISLRAAVAMKLSIKMKMVQEYCDHGFPDYYKASFQDIILNCVGFPIQAIANLMNTKDQNLINLLGSLSPSVMMEITKLSAAMFQETSMLNLSVMVSQKVVPALRGFDLPISAYSASAMVPFASLSTFAPLAWAAATSKLPESALRRVFNAPSTINNLQFGALPPLILSQFQQHYSVNHFLTSSFTGLIRFLVKNRTNAVAVEEFTKGARYLALRPKLSQILQIYNILRNQVERLTVPELTRRYAGITSSQLQAVLNFTKEREERFEKVSIENAGIILNKVNEIYNMTVERIGHEIVNLGNEGVTLFETANRILLKRCRSPLELRNISVYDLLTTHGNITTAVLQRVISGLRGHANFVAFLKLHPIRSLARPLGLNQTFITSQETMINVLRRAREYFGQDEDRCANFEGCHPNANCSNIPGAVKCTCNPGYQGNGFTCTDVNECKQNPCHKDASCKNNDGSFTCRCNNGYNGNGISCNDINECQTAAHNCHKDAICDNNVGSFTCRCKSGLGGDGTFCVDFCKTHKPCGENSKCFVDRTTAFCECDDGYTLENNKCQTGSKVVTISGMRLNVTYSAAFADRNSAEFQNFSRTLAATLKASMQSDSVAAIQIISIRKGSIIVDYVIVVKKGKTLTDSQAQQLAVQALNSPQMATYKPDTTVTPSAQSGDICSLGTHKCGANSQCKSQTDGSFTCDCIDGYEKEDGECKKKRNLAVIVAPIVVVVVILIVGTIICLYAYKKKKGESGLEDQRYAHFKANEFEMGGTSNVYFKNVSEKD